jgi:hypothetical protein
MPVILSRTGVPGERSLLAGVARRRTPVFCPSHHDPFRDREPASPKPRHLDRSRAAAERRTPAFRPDHHEPFRDREPAPPKPRHLDRSRAAAERRDPRILPGPPRALQEQGTSITKTSSSRPEPRSGGAERPLYFARTTTTPSGRGSQRHQNLVISTGAAQRRSGETPVFRPDHHERKQPHQELPSNTRVSRVS